MPIKSSDNSIFGKLKQWIVGVTGVVLVVPALINGAVDIYASLAKLPKTESEKTNVELFKKYFNKQPIAAYPIPIKQSNGTVQVLFSVYDGGDVYIEYGSYSQWFPFPRAEKNTANLSLVPNAVADPEGAELVGAGKFSQSEKFKDGLVVRERLWDNGLKESFTINPKTGKIENVQRQNPSGDTALQDIPIGIDLANQQSAKVNSNLPSNYFMQQCGCWGYISPSQTFQEPRCASGGVHPIPCPGYCPNGGVPYAFICN